MQNINLSYDKQCDILYARLPFNGHSYGKEANGIITYHHMIDGSVTGIAIYSFGKRFNAGDLNLELLPVPLDSIVSKIKKLLLA